jgi:ElaA protein
MTQSNIQYFGNEYVYRISAFDELATRELYEILRLRQEIFMVEQACAFLDNDRFDYAALHLQLFSNNELIGYARILPPNSIYKEASIGRVSVALHLRGKSLGRLVFDLSLKACFDAYPQEKIKIQAQSYLLEFYSSFGFTPITEGYYDTGILHHDMILLPHAAQGK